MHDRSVERGVEQRGHLYTLSAANEIGNLFRDDS